MKNIIHIPVKFLLFFTVILMISSLFWLKDIVFLDEMILMSRFILKKEIGTKSLKKQEI